MSYTIKFVSIVVPSYNEEGNIKLLAEKIFTERNLKVAMKADPAKNFLRVQFPRTTVDISKVKALGWEPKITEAEGFKKTVESYEAN